MRLYSTEEVSIILGISRRTVRYRSDVLEIKFTKVDTERGYFYTTEQLYMIRDYKYKTRPASRKNLYDSIKIKIIEYFKNNKSNTVKDISVHLNVRSAIIEKALNEYLKDKTVIVSSKMNYENNR